MCTRKSIYSSSTTTTTWHRSWYQKKRASVIDRNNIDLLTNIFVLKALGWCFPGISGVGRSSLILAERSRFSLISCSTWSIFVTKYIVIFMGITFFPADTQIRTTEKQDYKRAVYLLDHNVTLTSILFYTHICRFFHWDHFYFRWHSDSNHRRPSL